MRVGKEENGKYLINMICDHLTRSSRRSCGFRGGSKGWPGEPRPPPCESCAPRGPPNETVCKVAKLHNTSVYLQRGIA